MTIPEVWLGGHPCLPVDSYRVGSYNREPESSSGTLLPTPTPLTGIVLHQGLEGGEGDPRRDVIATVVQGADLIVLDHLPLGGDILHRQGKGT